ncbi:hypothetical protein MIR68_008315 [Amoeboaphelidium protococcarum]|nr:hypothetical protein MIR68_008315 [Amoeboaphelidium protococcarum]
MKIVHFDSELTGDKESLKVSDIEYLHPCLVKALQQLGFDHLFPVQLAVLEQTWRNTDNDNDINSALTSDILISAPTGSGKSLAYILPMLNYILHDPFTMKVGNNGRDQFGYHLPRALIVLPTKDLVVQTAAVLQSILNLVNSYSSDSTDGLCYSIKAVSMYGGNNNGKKRRVHNPSCDNPIVEMSANGVDAERLKIIADLSKDPLSQQVFKCDIIISTPHRLMDHIIGVSELDNQLDLSHLKYLILDEADGLLQQSNISDDWLSVLLDYIHGSNSGMSSFPWSSEAVNFINDDDGDNQLFHPLLDAEMFLRSSRKLIYQKIILSATLSQHIGDLSQLRLNNPILLKCQTSVDTEDQNDSLASSLSSQQYSLPTTLQQQYIITPEPSEFTRPACLTYLMRHLKVSKALCFVNNVDKAQKLLNLCTSGELSEYYTDYRNASQVDLQGEQKFAIAYYSSQLPQHARQQIVKKFQQGQINILVCTDALARGVDFQDEQGLLVIHYDAPPSVQSYVHRAGRTARAGKSGRSIMILNRKESHFWRKQLTKMSLAENITVIKLPSVNESDDQQDEDAQLLQQCLGACRNTFEALRQD